MTDVMGYSPPWPDCPTQCEIICHPYTNLLEDMGIHVLHFMSLAFHYDGCDCRIKQIKSVIHGEVAQAGQLDTMGHNGRRKNPVYGIIIILIGNVHAGGWGLTIVYQCTPARMSPLYVRCP